MSSKRPLETALYFWNHRSIPPKQVIPFVQTLEASNYHPHLVWMKVHDARHALFVHSAD